MSWIDALRDELIPPPNREHGPLTLINLIRERVRKLPPLTREEWAAQPSLPPAEMADLVEKKRREVAAEEAALCALTSEEWAERLRHDASDSD
ncbi:hypothetical protein AB0383_49750 [Amycolatopsis sp. NPDC051373]|uniref:hypothetical protein n=1 Tax=Amycolatopsis sp. NPDC051373 TaxID=3155801 RepID=UPI00344FF2F0